jgi:hypothetical protein
MTPGAAILLLGCGLGVLVVASRSGPQLRQEATLRDRAIEAQRISAQASQRARELTERWIASQANSTR